MVIKLFSRVGICLFFLAAGYKVKAQTVPAGEVICGRWVSNEKNLTVEVYKENGEFRAKIVWFKTDDNSKKMGEWTDSHNPDKALRDRKILGMNVVTDLVYMPKTNTWEHGSIYDAKNGRYWDASAYLTKDGLLKVEGYWHFKFIGRTMTFKKAS